MEAMGCEKAPSGDVADGFPNLVPPGQDCDEPMPPITGRYVYPGQFTDTRPELDAVSR